MNDPALTRVLNDLVRDPVVPGDLGSRVVAAHARRRRRLAAVGGVACVAVVAFAVVAIPAATRRVTPVTPTGGPAAPGTMVAANGILVARPDGSVRFCQLRFRTDDLPIRMPDCAVSVTAAGVDVARATKREHVFEDGTKIADVWLKGTYRDGTLTVVEQGDPRYPDSRFVFPCAGATPTPAPGSEDVLDAGVAYRWRDAHPNDVVGMVPVHLDEEGRYGLVVTTPRPEVVEAALRPAYGPSLCVVRSRYTAEQITAAKADAETVALGPIGVTEEYDGQVYVRVRRFITDDEGLALVARHPAGLVRLAPWLEPA